MLDINNKLLHVNKAMRKILDLQHDDQIEEKMNKIFIEGIALIEHLKINKKVMFRQFEMEYHYIEATGETIIYANDMNLYLQCQTQDEVIANLNAEAQQKAAEITATIEIHQRQYRKQRLTITR